MLVGIVVAADEEYHGRGHLMVRFAAQCKVCGIVVGLALAVDKIHAPWNAQKNQVPTELIFVPGIQRTSEIDMALLQTLDLVMMLHWAGKREPVHGMAVAAMVLVNLHMD